MTPDRPGRFASGEASFFTKERAAGMALALVLEGCLLLALLSLAWQKEIGDFAQQQVVRFEARDLAEDTAEAPSQSPPAPALDRQTVASPQFEEAEADQPQPRPESPSTVARPPWSLGVIPLTREEMRQAQIRRDAAPQPQAAAQPSPRRQAYGPPDNRSGPPDTPRVSGTAPNGEPLYAASWYREPTDQELAGYLSTASGPGWALIACRTAPQFRVEDCVLEQEHPQGSKIGRSVLAAAWQFRVRPPRIGGKSQVGAWVRIHISYN